MKAVLIDKIGAGPKVADIDVPKPGSDDLLVKTLYFAFNPM